MYGFVIAIMLCSGNNCDLIQAEPDITYPSAETCSTALSSKAADLKSMADKHASADRPARLVCLHPIETIVEVEQPHDVLDTAIVHKEPSASSLFVGLVEKGSRTLVTGLVAGTGWVRVLLPDGKSGFVYAERLRRVGDGPRTASVTAPPDAMPGPAAPAPEAAPASPPPQTTAVASPPQATPAVPAPRAASAPQPQTAPPPAQIAVAQPPSVPSPAPAASPPPASPTVGRREFRDCQTCPIMIPIPPGSFEMGSNDDPSERPPHRVTVRAFALAKFELTIAEWNACVAAGACSYKPPGGASLDRRPVSNLSWTDADQYVQWLQKVTGEPYRLPSEAEWEYAAAAGANTRYSWGAQAGAGKADCRGCGGSGDSRQPAEVGSFAANAWSLYGMEGGVAEWVADCWHTSYKDAPSDGGAWQGPHCSSHVLRGGSWMNPPSDITIRDRNFYDTDVRYIANGVRVALTMH